MLQTTLQDRLLRLTLNRPEKRNALNQELCGALLDAFDRAESDPNVGCVLIDANGPVFCAGMDLEDALQPNAAELTASHPRLFTAGLRATKPIVAAVQGAALAGGLGLVANAHIVVAAQGTSFGLTEVRIGMWPYVVFRPIALAVGERRALELSLTGRIFSTPEALQYGLVHHATPAFELADRALSIAQALAHSSTGTIARGMAYVNEIRDKSWEQAVETAADLRQHAFTSPDFAEGVAAMREKRQPRWNLSKE